MQGKALRIKVSTITTEEKEVDLRTLQNPIIFTYEHSIRVVDLKNRNKYTLWRS